MATVRDRHQANAFLRKAQEYLDSAHDNLDAGRYTPAAGDAIHAGISAKDAMITTLTGAATKGQNHAAAIKELRTALTKRQGATAAEKALRELISAKTDVEYGPALTTAAKAEPLVRRARTLVELAVDVVRLGR
jgi:HEPN domain-containing protein